MKKLFLFASAAAMLATSCSDDLGLKNPQAGVVDGKSRIIATYPIGADEGTRTSLVPNGNTMSYIWNEGDAIGVYGLDGGVRNATFSFAGNNQFNGDVELVADNTYFGYYPQSSQTKLTNNGNYELNLYISSEQNFNTKVLENNEGGLNPGSMSPLSGSFAQGEAPAVAYAAATESEDGKVQLSFDFQPVAAYMVFPITSIEEVTISKLVLSVGATSASTDYNNGSYQNINGTVNVNMSNLRTNDGELQANYGINAADGGTETTLYCGTNGVTIGGEDEVIQNFWFVVPGGLYIKGAEVNVAVYLEGDDDANPSYTINKVLTPSRDQALANKTLLITPENNTPWTYTGESDTDEYIIYNQAQFIEYAYLVTNGYNAIKQWLEEYNEGNSMSNSSLLRMLSYYGDKKPENLMAENANISSIVNGVKNASILRSITFSKETLADDLGLTITSGTPGYFGKVYSQFATTGTIPTIGGGSFGNIPVSYTISGYNNNDVTPTLTNLNITSTNGEGLLCGAKTGSNGYNFGHLKDLTFKNLSVNVGTIDPETNYYLLAQPYYSNFVNVTVSGQLTGSGQFGEGKTSLFLNDKSSNYTYTEEEDGVYTYVNPSTDVTNNTTLLFAQTLTIDNAGSDPFTFDFTQNGRNYTQYGNIVLSPYNSSKTPARQGFGSLLRVAAGQSNAEGLITKINDDDPDNTITVYSIIDTNNVSYWTGRVAGSLTANNSVVKGTAEDLACLVRETTAQTFDPEYNVNLMGNFEYTPAGSEESVPMRWYALNTAGVNINGGKDGVKISNAFIDGTTDGKTPITGGNVSLFGKFSWLVNVTVEDIIIDNSETQVALPNVGAISTYPSYSATGVTSDLTVNNITMNLYNPNAKTTIYSGGLYSIISTAMYNLKDITLNGFKGTTATGSEGKVTYGWLAGQWIYSVAGNTEFTNPVDYTGNYKYIFGNWNLGIKVNNVYETFAIKFIDMVDYLNMKDVTFALTDDSTGKPGEGANLNVFYDNDEYLYQYVPGENDEPGEFTWYGSVTPGK